MPVEVEMILNNDLLTFPLSNIATTGEILRRPQTAEYKGMKISIRPGGIVSIRGSLHKLREGGTNYKDFTLNDIREIVRKLTETFEFDPEQTFINFVEVGINLPLNYSPSDLIKTAVMYRNAPFETLRTDGKGFGKVCETQRFDIKIYDKSLQYGLPEHLLRFEVKVKRTEFLKKYGINNLTLADLTRSDFYPAFLQILLDTLDEVLFYDPNLKPQEIETQKDRELVLQGRYPEFWKTLPRTTKKRKLERFIELTGGTTIKSEIATLIKQKWNKLTDCTSQLEDEKTEQINHLQKGNEKIKTEQINTKVNGYSVPACPITDLQMHNQKSGSKYLTTLGIKWYQVNDNETYSKILLSILTEKWKSKHENAPEKIWIGEIAHQIRNKFYNPGNNAKRVSGTENMYKKCKN